MKYVWALIAIVVLASGCMSSDSPEEGFDNSDSSFPEDEGQSFEDTGQEDSGFEERPDSDSRGQPSFSEIATRAETSEYHVEYRYDGTGPLIYSGEPEVYSHGGVRKVARPGDMPGGGRVSYNVYYKDDIEVDCSEGLGDDARCSTLPTDVAPSTDHYSDRIERFNVTKKGSRTRLGRECYMYRLSEGDFINSYMDICLDRQKGFVSFLEMRSPEYNRTIMDMEAVDYEAEASEEDVRPPVKAVPWVTCYSGDLNITTTDYSGEVKFQVNDGDNRTINMEEWSVRTLNVSEEMEDGKNTVKTYAGGTSGSSYCRR